MTTYDARAKDDLATARIAAGISPFATPANAWAQLRPAWYQSGGEGELLECLMSWRTQGTKRQQRSENEQGWLDEYCRLEEMPTIPVDELVEYLVGLERE